MTIQVTETGVTKVTGDEGIGAIYGYLQGAETNVVETVAQLHRQYGDRVHLLEKLNPAYPPTSLYFARVAPDNRTILLKGTRSAGQKNTYEEFGPIFAGDDAEWLEERRQFSEGLNSASIRSYFTEAAAIVNAEMSIWKQDLSAGKPFNYRKRMLHLVRKLTSTVMLAGYTIADEFFDELAQYIALATPVLFARAYRPDSSTWSEIKNNNLYESTKPDFDARLTTILTEALEATKNEFNSDKAGLLRAIFVNPSQVNWEKARRRAKAGLNAATDTTLNVILWLSYRLKSVLADIRQELQDATGGKMPSNLDDLKKMPKLAGFIAEGLRHLPQVPIANRQVDNVEGLTLDDGYFLPQGTQCFANVYETHMSSIYYGENAAGFKPAMMTDKFIENLPAGAHEPFMDNSAHQCVGDKWSRTEMAIIFIGIVITFSDIIMPEPDYFPPTVYAATWGLAENALPLGLAI